jgi:opacity protein-like surface antigen
MRKALIGLALALAASGAVAQGAKGYVAAGAGMSKFDIEACNNGLSCDDSGFAWNFRAGYHVFPWLGLEAAFLDFGAGRIPGVLVNPPPNTVPIPVDSDIRASGFVASVVGRVPLGPVSLVGRAGWGAITGKFRGNAAVQDVSTGAITHFSAQNRETTNQFVFGAGVTFDLGPGWTLRADWDRTKAEDGMNPKFDVDMFTAGVGYRF